MEFVSGVFHFRWILWIFGIAVLLMQLPAVWKNYGQKLESYCDTHWKNLLLALCSGFFLFAFLGKFSQYWTFNLHGQDFWLFVDILENMKKGGFLLTRFAPQDLGMVQHGSVHPTLTWGLLLPLAWIVGSTYSALIHNPLVLSLAAGILGLITRRSWGSFYSLLWVSSFLASTQVGKVLLYEVHPEAAYPLFVFLWFWSIGLDGTKRIRYFWLIFASVFCAGVKEDSFLVFGPFIFLSVFYLKGIQRNAALISGGIAVLVCCFQLFLVNRWVSGAWGPAEWMGYPVLNQVGLGFFKGQHWSGFSDVLIIIQHQLDDQGGFLGWLNSLLKFLISRPWLSLIVFAPWVVLSYRFWFSVFPLASVYSIFDAPKVLWNYYSAPFLGLFWFFASEATKSQKKMIWVFCASCLLGSSSVDIFIPSPKVDEIHHQVQAVLPCMGEKGVVASHLIRFLPLKKIWSDRVPRTPEQWSRVDFVLFSPDYGRFEMPLGEVKRMSQYLVDHPEWKRIGKDCQQVTNQELENVVLFKRVQLNSRH